ncbi:MAG: glutamine synthetase beta-grasp domain-containing protein, partial [Pseudomonadota bacterium]|nr:glutamine synthetase beta-grasp domain-containing protein [Pseudomonadota bacterium]
MMKSKLEYIWLDGYMPTQSLRSKTQVIDNFGGTLEECPMWSFDGSSTEQADGSSSDCLLKPVAIFPDPGRLNSYLVMTEVLNADGTPHVSNGRATIDDDDDDFWFGFEQEYFLWDIDTNLPPGFPPGGYPGPQGPYYCSVGAANAFGRDCVEEHFDLCLAAGINVEGINAEVAAGQWEFQVFAKGAKRAGDETWIARYLLERIGEKYGYSINWHPKPFGKLDWNGSGMHANFSNEVMRT